MKRGLTDLRKKILGIIAKANKPLRAKDIHEIMSFKSDFSTVYRALEFLSKKEMIKSIYLDSNIRFYYSIKDSHLHYIICKNCHTVKKFDQCFANDIQSKLEKKYEIEIHDHFFYFVGICKKCSKI